MENATNPLLAVPVVLSAAWILWDTLYSSVFFAFLVKTLINLFLKDAGIHIGQCAAVCACCHTIALMQDAASSYHDTVWRRNQHDFSANFEIHLL